MNYSKFWEEFFQLYKDLPSLWRIGSSEYHDRVLKSKCYLQLIDKLKELYPDADREMVVKKIERCRSSCRNELKKIKESKRAGKVYTPKLWYFNYLSFLYENETGQGLSNEDEESTREKKGGKKSTSNQQRFEFVEQNVEEEEEEFIPKFTKKKQVKLSHKEQQAKDDADILAKSWAAQYIELQERQKLIARKLISNILFYGCLGSLNMDHIVNIEGLLQNESSKTQQSSFQFQSPVDSDVQILYTEQEISNNESIQETIIEYCSSPPLPPSTNSMSEIVISDITFEDTKKKDPPTEKQRRSREIQKRSREKRKLDEARYNAYLAKSRQNNAKRLKRSEMPEWMLQAERDKYKVYLRNFRARQRERKAKMALLQKMKKLGYNSSSYVNSSDN